jgi:hypothetical protein
MWGGGGGGQEERVCRQLLSPQAAHKGGGEREGVETCGQTRPTSALATLSLGFFCRSFPLLRVRPSFDKIFVRDEPNNYYYVSRILSQVMTHLYSIFSEFAPT